MTTFFFKYCPNGHLLWSRHSESAQKRCEHCGELFIERCQECDTPVRNSFEARPYLTNGRPVGGFPSKPKNCRECGVAYPLSGAEIKDLDRDFWELLHPKVVEVARPRYEAGHYADAVESALKALNSNVKQIYKERSGEERDGVDLMHAAFSPKRPLIVLGDQQTETGRNMQQGYMALFAGSMAGIRNPKAHDNIVIDETRAIHHLFVASLLFFKLDEQA